MYHGIKVRPEMLIYGYAYEWGKAVLALRVRRIAAIKSKFRKHFSTAIGGKLQYKSGLTFLFWLHLDKLVQSTDRGDFSPFLRALSNPRVLRTQGYSMWLLIRIHRTEAQTHLQRLVDLAAKYVSLRILARTLLWESENYDVKIPSKLAHPLLRLVEKRVRPNRLSATHFSSLFTFCTISTSRRQTRTHLVGD